LKGSWEIVPNTGPDCLCKMGHRVDGALRKLGSEPWRRVSRNHNVVTISGIGCSSNLPGFINTYGMHTLHGRALAVATGVKLANHELTVLLTGGDGDGFGIGGNHFVHSMRRNVAYVDESVFECVQLMPQL